jgi:hypothetical protein
MGNIKACKALLVFILDADIRLSQPLLDDAEKLWEETKEQMASRMRRVAPDTAKKCGDCVGKIVRNLLKCGKSAKM